MARVYANMTGDLLHYGHIAFFKRARNYGTHLIIGVHSDEDVKKYKRNPIMNLRERIAVIEACSLINEVIPKAPLITTKKFIKYHKIDTVVATEAYSAETLEFYYGDPKQMGILKLVKYQSGISTTEIIKRCGQFLSSEKGSLEKNL